MKEKASELGRTARERAMTAIDQQKGEVGGLLDRLADTMEGDRIGGYAADYARRGAGYLRRTSADELWSSARTSLRSRPGLLLGACFVAGLALGRILRGDRSDERGYEDAERAFGEYGYEGPSDARTWPVDRSSDEPRP